MADYPELKQMLYAILFRGKYFAFNRYNLPVNIGLMLGFLKDMEGSVAVSNRIFETCLYNLFLSEDLTNSTIYDTAASDRNLFVKNGYLDMELVLERFVNSFTDTYSDAEDRFLEDYHLTTGYMVSFNFNKHKQTGIRKIEINGKIIIEAVV